MLWLAVIASGLYHGVNPGMGWPLAVSAGLMERSPRALVAALGPLAAGHLLAMLLVILPFALLVAVVEWQRPIQIGASLLVIAFGLFRLANRRHPRVLARFPLEVGDIAPGAHKAIAVPIDFARCSENARFATSLVFSSNNGAVVGNATDDTTTR